MDIQQFRDDPKTTYLAREYDRLQAELIHLDEVSKEDPSLKELAEEDRARLISEQQALWSQMEDILSPSGGGDDSEPVAVVMEFRAGAGGDEAALFATDLARMYMKYAEKKGWETKPLDSGLESLEVRGKGVYDLLRHETGVHRVQRIPITEKSGRIHTSTASVAILPIRNHSKMELNPADIEIEFSRSGGAGGQNVTKWKQRSALFTSPPASMCGANQRDRKRQTVIKPWLFLPRNLRRWPRKRRRVSMPTNGKHKLAQGIVQRKFVPITLRKTE